MMDATHHTDEQHTSVLLAMCDAAAQQQDTPPEPKRCIGCGRRQEPDGTLPCGH